jgi:hypothetical protein
MAQVHTFSLITELFSDTRIPLQYLGGGNAPAARQVELMLLVEYIAAQLAIATEAVSVTSGDTIAVTGGNLIACIAVEAAVGARTMKIGTSAGAEDVMELTSIPSATDFTFTLNRYTSTTLTLHFTLTGGSASILVFTEPKA